jgi:hypothetical protein
MLITTTINHIARRKLGLSFPEYIFVDMVDKLSRPYCNMSRPRMADEMGMSRRGIQKMIERLEEKGILERSENDEIKTTDLWFSAVVWANSEKENFFAGKRERSSRQGRTQFAAGANSVRGRGELSSPNTSIDTSSDTEETRENAQAREISSIVQPEADPKPESPGAIDVPTSTPPKYDLESLIHLWIDKATRSSVVRNYEGDPEKLKQAAEAAAAHYIGKELEYPAKDERVVGLALEKSTGSTEALKLTRWLQRRSQFESKPKQSRNGKSKLTFDERKQNAAASVNAAREAGRRYAERKRREAEGDFGHYAVG